MPHAAAGHAALAGIELSFASPPPLSPSSSPQATLPAPVPKKSAAIPPVVGSLAEKLQGDRTRASFDRSKQQRGKE